MRILVIDGQGGGMGAMIVRALLERGETDITAIGTNSSATLAMMRAGARAAATGENPVVRAAPRAEVIMGPIGIIAAHSIMGEVTPAMAEAVSGSDAKKVLLPVTNCNVTIPGLRDAKLPELVSEAVELALTAN